MAAIKCAIQLNHGYLILLITWLISINRLVDCKNVEWYASRHKPVAKLKNVLLIAADGPDKGKPITVNNCGTSSVARRIVGGAEAKAGQFPWDVLILVKNEPICGGAILNERWIISAAHCFKSKMNANGIAIKVGMVDSSKGTTYKTIKLVKHTKFNHDKMNSFDIALLQTDRPIKMERDNNVQMINGVCLPGKNKEPEAKRLVLSGWGRTGDGEEPSRMLRMVELDIIGRKECKTKFQTEIVGFQDGYKINEQQICTHNKNKDACQGDSGGPAIETVDGTAYLVGIVSFGVGCATEYPGVLTKVSNYLDWIAQNMS